MRLNSFGVGLLVRLGWIEYQNIPELYKLLICLVYFVWLAEWADLLVYGWIDYRCIIVQGS